ncbi:EAL domain-containing protein [Azonexus sp. IMCC34839]|uniref:two-component system response regulator n=1 Tax=Azonexus sp. IMCC34839 TaxID=3133695 RepID=UPI00399AF432
MSAGHDDDLVFVEDDVEGHETSHKELTWHILIVDDDQDVHEATEFALGGIEILGRRLSLAHAYSGQEAIAYLGKHADIAVILLDVVMESDDAGLKTVDSIRNELQLHNTRIILRTGQPGQAPETETITRYDINDYKTKSELSHAKLFTTLTAALRSYDQLQRLDASRQGLEKIVAASNQFIAEKGLHSFAEGVITQLASLIGIAPEGLVCAAAEEHFELGQEYRVIAAAGNYRHLIQHRLTDIDNRHILDCLTRALNEKRGIIGQREVTLYFRKAADEGFAAYIESSEPIKEIDQHLLEVFCTNIALCAKNIDLVAELRRDALYDRQVGLPNRNALLAEVDQRLNLARKYDTLVLLDIDQFGAINDMFGHKYGDALLKEMALRLRKDLDSEIFIARLAGDAFALVGSHRQLAPSAIQRLFAPPFRISDIEHAITVSMGLCALGDNLRGTDVLKNAYLALRRAKTMGIAQHVLFSSEIGQETRERMQLLLDLRQAFEHRRLHLVYQPQVELNSGQIIGVEALLRWQQDDGSMIPPDRFIPIAEQSGLIVSIGRWIITEALSALQRFRQAGWPDLRMAINISTVQLRQADFFDFLDEVMLETGTSPDNVELEITESVALEGMAPMVNLLNRLRQRGISIAIDDFGTGYSSLNYLEQLPIDHLKIDRSFILSLSASDRGERIVRTIAKLGNELQLKTVAEGVETAEALEKLREIGCRAAQGYHFSRPLKETELLAWLEESK